MSDLIITVQKALEEVSYSRHEIPKMILKLLREDSWRLRKPESGLLETKEFSSFPEFVEASRPYGLQSDWKFINELCKGFEEVELELAKSINRKSNSIENKDSSSQKTQKQKYLLRLEKERPDLLEKVEQKELTVNAAMIEAGFLKPRIKANKEPKSVADMIKNHFSNEEITEIIKMLMS